MPSQPNPVELLERALSAQRNDEPVNYVLIVATEGNVHTHDCVDDGLEHAFIPALEMAKLRMIRNMLDAEDK